MATFNYSVEKDVEDVHKAIQEKQPINLFSILGRRTNKERLLISQKYQLTHREAIDEAVSEEIEDYAEMLTTDYRISAIELLKDAFDEEPVNTHVVYRLYVQAMELDISMLTKLYYFIIGNNLLEDLENIEDVELRQSLKDVTSGMKINMSVDWIVENLANNDLFSTPENKRFLLTILLTSTYKKIVNINHEYKEKTEQLLVDTINDKTNGDYQYMLKTIVLYSQNQSNVVADWIYELMELSDQNEKSLLFTLLTRAPRDLQTIKEIYQNKNNKTISDAIKEEWAPRELFVQLALFVLNEQS